MYILDLNNIIFFIRNLKSPHEGLLLLLLLLIHQNKQGEAKG